MNKFMRFRFWITIAVWSAFLLPKIYCRVSRTTALSNSGPDFSVDDFIDRLSSIVFLRPVSARLDAVIVGMTNPEGFRATPSA